MRISKAFTLIELLVALLVLAVTVSMFGTATSRSFQSLERVQERTLASWVASNQLAVFRLERKSNTEPMVTGRRMRITQMAGRDWQVESTIRPTGHPWLRRVEVRVRPVEIESPDTWSASLVGYIGRH